MATDHPEAEAFRQARRPILIFAWLGLSGMTLLGLGALTWVAIMLTFFPDHIGALTGDTIAFCLFILIAVTSAAYGVRAFLALLRCGRHLAADGDLGLALEQHRLFWRRGTILSGLLLLEILGLMVVCP
jgi:hypothetical protein